MWERVIRPQLEKQLELRTIVPYFSLIPSTTYISRTSLVAGASPGDWRNSQGDFSDNEELLSRMFFGVGNGDGQQQLKYLTNAVEKIPNLIQNQRPLNLIVVNSCDDLIHHHNVDPYTVGTTLSQLISSFISNLLMLVGEKDVILVSSDHGFIELDPEDKVDVSNLMDEHQDITYRYTKNVAVPDTLEVKFLGNESLAQSTFHVATGHRWMNRGGGQPRKYAHGGVSFSEMVVPGAVMALKQETESRVSWSNKPPMAIELLEGATFEFEPLLHCHGSEPIKYDLVAQGASLSPVNGTIRPRSDVQIKVVIPEDQPSGLITISAKSVNQSDEDVSPEQLEIRLTRKTRTDRVVFDSGALDLLEDN